MNSWIDTYFHIRISCLDFKLKEETKFNHVRDMETKNNMKKNRSLNHSQTHKQTKRRTK